MLNIKNLEATIDNKHILKGINLDINPGEVHAIMGPNGSGKSTLASVVAGKEDYEVEKGEISFEGQNIDELSAGNDLMFDEALCFSRLNQENSQPKNF